MNYPYATAQAELDYLTDAYTTAIRRAVRHGWTLDGMGPHGAYLIRPRRFKAFGQPLAILVGLNGRVESLPF